MSSVFDRMKHIADRIERTIYVKGQYEGFHAYKNAPEEVAFLRNSHRHIFKWEADISVFHDDRELEFFMVKKRIQEEILLFMEPQHLGSCEQQAEFILKGLVNMYGPDREYWIDVSEDGENGATIRWYGVN